MQESRVQWPPARLYVGLMVVNVFRLRTLDPAATAAHLLARCAPGMPPCLTGAGALDLRAAPRRASAWDSAARGSRC